MEHEKIFSMVLDRAVDKILDWSFSDDHPLEQCSDSVQQRVKIASFLARDGRYEEAVEELTLAAREDPSYVGTRVRAMKYLITDEKPLLSLLIGGGVLVLTQDAKPQSQIWDMAGGVAFDIYRRSQSVGDLCEALAFANKATRLAPYDIVSAWNRLEILLAYSVNSREAGLEEQADRLMTQARAAADNIMEFGRQNRNNASRYWQRLLLDAEGVFPDDEWWRVKLIEMRQVGKRLAEDVDLPLPSSGPPQPRNRHFGWNAARVGVLLALLAWPTLHTTFSRRALPPACEPTPTEFVQPAQAPATVVPAVPAQKSSVDFEEPNSDQVGRLNHDDDELADSDLSSPQFARLDRDEVELAYMRSLLNTYRSRMERDEVELS